MPTKKAKPKSPKADNKAEPDLLLSGKARSEPVGRTSPAQARIAWRRNLIAQLYLTGAHTIDTIKQYLDETFTYKIHRATIAEDLKQLKLIWEKNAAMTTAEHLTAELDKLQALELWCMENLRNGVFSPEKFSQEVVRLMKRRHSILGLDKTKLEVTDRRLEDLSDAELAVIAAGRKADTDAA